MVGYVINLDSRQDRLKLFREQEFPFEVKRVSGVVASCGEDGCTASHLSILKKQTKFPFVIFEDDCKMLYPWSMVEMIMKQLPRDWDGLWLGGNVKKKLPKYSENLYSLKNTFALHAVIYNSKVMVDYIVKKHRTIPGNNLDIFYRLNVERKYRCFITYPMIATQRSDVSDIGGNITDHEEIMLKNYIKNVHE